MSSHNNYPDSGNTAQVEALMRENAELSMDGAWLAGARAAYVEACRLRNSGDEEGFEKMFASLGEKLHRAG